MAVMTLAHFFESTRLSHLIFNVFFYFLGASNAIIKILECNVLLWLVYT